MTDHNDTQDQEPQAPAPDELSAQLSAALRSHSVSGVIDRTAEAIVLHGLGSVARASGTRRTTLYSDFLEEREPTLRDFLRVIHALGVELSASARR